MNEEVKGKLAVYLQRELHEYCSGYMFSDEAVLECINDFFNIEKRREELLKKKAEIEREIEELDNR
jgi:hypothetical protein